MKDWLDSLGRDEWELIAVVSGPANVQTFYFKNPRPNHDGYGDRHRGRHQHINREGVQPR